MLATSWWFFVLIMVSSYTANLAAFLTVETLVAPFSTVEELASKKTIKYGAKSGGSTLMFFKVSVSPIVSHSFNGSRYRIYKKKNNVAIGSNEFYRIVTTPDVLISNVRVYQFSLAAVSVLSSEFYVRILI